MAHRVSESSHRKRIGDYLIEKGLIRQESVDEILKLCDEKKLRFGEAAIELGLITEDQLRETLAYPYQKEVFIRLNPDFFPRATKSVLRIEEILEMGILPLGFKTKWKLFRRKKVLNLVHVGREPSPEASAWAKQSSDECQFFHALPHEFLRICTVHYGFREKGALKNGAKLHGALKKVLELHGA